MSRVMPLLNLGTERREPRRRRSRLYVASADPHPELQAKLGDAAHAGAADSDKVEPALARQKTIGVQFTHAADFSMPATSKQTFAT